MKRALKVTLLAITAFVTIASISGCKVDEGGIYGAFPYMNVPFTDTLLSKVEQTITIPIETNRTIGANVTDALWLKARTEGNNLILTALKNEQETQRTANVEVYTVNSTVKTNITVVQSASGELTIIGDLILPYANEVEENTYTKTTGSLIVGKVTSMTPASVSSTIAMSLNATPAANSDNVFVRFNNQILEVVPTDISNRHVDILTEKIHMIGSRSLAFINTNVSSFPYKLTYDNRVNNLCLAACSFQELPSVDSLKALNLRELNMSYNNLTSVSSIKGLDSLKRLDIAYNHVEDISALSENANIEELVLDGNPIINIEGLGQLKKLKKLSLKELPILPTQYELLTEQLPQECVTDTTGIKPENSPLVRIGQPKGNKVDEVSFSVTAKIDGGVPSNTGFYWGKSKKLNEMEFVSAEYSDTDNTFSAKITGVDTQTNVYFFRGYAENSSGKSYSEINRFGDIVWDENYQIRNNTDFEDFYNKIITQIKGSLFIGYGVLGGNAVIIDVPVGDQVYKFAPSEITSLAKMSNVSYIEGGLYVVNNPITSIGEISKIEHAARIWVEGNKIINIPDLSKIQGLRTINVARNQISDFTPLLKLENLDTLYLGNNNYIYEESNNIGVLDGLETMTNLKYLDLSGLPLHNWQVEQLKDKMPGCEIVFSPGNRTPFLPAVRSESASISGSKVTIRGGLENKGEGQIIEYGFRWGKDKNNLEKVVVSTSNDIGNGSTFSYELDIPDEDRYYYQPYVINTYGEANSMDYREFTLSFTNLSERGTSNSYIVSNAGRYTLAANIIGNGSAGIIDTANFHTTDVTIYPTQASLVWQTAENVITDISFLPETQEILITTSGTEGNALIAATDDSGNILWSWHIWCTDKPADHIYINSSGQTYTVQDRNLGATRADRGTGDQWIESTGVFFQWGRKDPLDYNHSNHISSKLTIEETILNPISFPTHSEWMLNKNKNLWSRKIKTIYDPCPVGYKVANKEAWTSFSTTGVSTNSHSEMNIKGSWDNGYYFIYDGTNAAWYPAACNTAAQNYGRVWYSNGDDPNAFNNGWDDDNDWTCIPSMEYTYNSDLDESVRFENCWSYTGSPSYVRCMLDLGYVDITLPSVTLNEITEIGHSSATVKATVTSEGSSSITSVGFVIGTRHNPTKENGTVISQEPVIGEICHNFTDLSGFTTYYVRAFAENANGTAYSQEKSFTTEYNGIINNLSESGTANCYIVPPTTDHYSFDVSVMGNGYQGIIDNANFHTNDVHLYPESIEVLWSQRYDDYYTSTLGNAKELLSFIELNKDNRTVHIVPTGVEGNVLIAAKDANDVIIWSWHLWITDKPAEQNYVNYEGQYFTLLDRNIGATRADRGSNEEWRESLGTKYQWGRKDPFTWNHQTASIKFTFQKSIENPDRRSDNWLWMDESSATRRAWDDTLKTIYDPCPVGYKVAPTAAWSNFCSNGLRVWNTMQATLIKVGTSLSMAKRQPGTLLQVMTTGVYPAMDLMPTTGHQPPQISIMGINFTSITMVSLITAYK